MFFGSLACCAFFFVCTVRSHVAKHQTWFNIASFYGFAGMMISLGA